MLQFPKELDLIGNILLLDIFEEVSKLTIYLNFLFLTIIKFLQINFHQWPLHYESSKVILHYRLYLAPKPLASGGFLLLLLNHVFNLFPILIHFKYICRTAARTNNDQF